MVGDTYVHWCVGYSETCSDTTHQTIEYCAYDEGALLFCAYFFPDVNLANQGYRVNGGGFQYWDPANPGLSLAYTITAVAIFHEPVVWGFDIEESSIGTHPNGFVTFFSSGENWLNGSHEVHVVGTIGNNQLAELLPGAPAGAGGGYFIVKNSFGDCWGDAGFAYVPFESFLHYTLELVSAPRVE